MAGRVSTLYVRVVGDVSNYERNMVKASASTAMFGREVKSQERHLLQFSRGALLGSGALAGITRAIVFASSAFVGAYGLTYGIKSATDAAKEFQSEMELIATQAGASQREVTKMSKAILKVAPSLGQTPDALSKGLYHLESAGIRGKKAMEALKVASKGAAVGHAGLEETVNALVGAFKSGISGAGNFGHTMAVLSSIVGAGNIRMRDLEGALGTGILSAGRAFGLTFKDVGAALATLSVGAVPVQEAATRLRMSFALLGGAGTVKANKALDTIGLSTRKLAQDLRSGGIVKGIGDLKEHLSSLSKIDQTRLLTQAFGGGRFSTSIITLVQQFDLLKQRMGQIDHGVRMFGESWRHTQKTAEFATAKFKASLSVLQIEIGNALLPVLTRTFNAVSKWFDKMNRTGQLQKDIHNTISAITGILQYFGDAIKAVEPTVKTFIDLLGGLKSAVISLGLAWLGMKTGLIPALGSVAKSAAIAGATGVASMRKVGTATEATTADVYALSAAERTASVSLFGIGKSRTAAATRELYPAQSAAGPLVVPTPGKMYKAPGGIAPSGVIPTAEQAKAAGFEPYTPAGLRPTYVEQTRPMIGGKPMIGPLEAIPVSIRNVKEQIDRTIVDETTRVERGLQAYGAGRIPIPAGAFQGGGEVVGGGITNPADAIKALKNAAATAEAEAKNLQVGSIAQKGKLNDAQELRGAANAIEKDAANLRMVQQDWMGQKVLGANMRSQFFGARSGEVPSGPYQVQIPGRRSLPIYNTAEEAYKKALETNGKVLDAQGREVDRVMGSQLLMRKETGLATKAMKQMGSGLSKVSSAASSMGSAINRQLASKGMGIGLAAAIGGPMAASYLGLPGSVGSVVQGAGIGLIGSSMLGVNPLAGVAVGTGVAAGKAIGGSTGHLTSGSLIGAGLGAAGAGAIAGSELGAAGGPLAGITIPIGAAVGALAGLGVAVLTLKRHTDTAADALSRLAKAAPILRKSLGQERRNVIVLRENMATDKIRIDSARQALSQAHTQEKAARGTKAHKVALDELNYAQAQYNASIRTARDDELAFFAAERQVGKSEIAQKTNLADQAKAFEKVGKAAMDTTRFVNGRLVSVDGGGLQGYIDKMNKLADDLQKKNPRFAKVARELANIAAQVRHIPTGKTISILLKYTVVGPRSPRPQDDRFSRQRQGAAARAAEARRAAADKPKPAKPIPPHAFAVPQKLLLEQAKASTEGEKAQIKADKDLLAYTEKEIKSGKLTQKGLIDAYNEEAQLQNDLDSLEKKKKKRKKKSTAKLAEILPPSFTSSIQRAQAGVSVAQATGIPTKEFAALTRLESVYQKALNFLKAEHETGAKRLLQIKEEASLTSKIADTRKQIKQLLADAIDTARQQFGGLFQGPLLAPSEAQQKAQLGMPGPDLGRMTADLKAQNAQMRRFTSDLTKLGKRGAPQELLKELQAMGPEAIPYIESLLKGSKKALDAFFKQFGQREKLVQKVAKIEMTAANVVIHAANLRQAGRVLARNPAGRRGSTTPGRPQPIPAAPKGKADGGLIPDSPRTMSGASGGVVAPIPGGVYRIAEAGHPEMVIPLDPGKRGRARELLDQTTKIIDRASGGIMRSTEKTSLIREIKSYRDGGIFDPRRKQNPVSPTDPNMKRQLDTPSARFVNRRAELLYKGEIALRQGNKADAYRLFEQARHMQLRKLGVEDKRGRPRPFYGPLTPELNFVFGPLADFFVPVTTSNRRMFSNLWHKFRHKPTLFNAGMLGMAVAAFVPGVGGALGRSAKASRIAWEALAGEKFVKSQQRFLKSGGHLLGTNKLGSEDWARYMFYDNETRLNKWIRGHVNVWGEPESLRGLPREQRVILRTLIKSMNSRRLKKDVVLFRGVNHDLLHTMRRRGGELGGPSGALPQAGEILKDRGILTTSVSAQDAKSFARGSYQSRRSSTGVLLKIMAHKGQHYLAGNPFEHEVLFPPGSEMKVLRVQKIMTESYKAQQKTIKTFLKAQKMGDYPRLINRLEGPEIAFKNPATGTTSFWAPGIYNLSGREHFLPNLAKHEQHLDMVTVDLKKRVPKFGKGGKVDPVPGGVYRVAEAGHPEMIIPLDPAKRGRAMHLIDKTMKIVSRSAGGMIERMTNCYRDGGIMPANYEMGGMVGAKMMGYADGGLIKPTFGRSQTDCIVRGQSSEQAPIELRVFLDGVDITKNVSVRQERKKQSTVPQRRGRHYGVAAT